MTIQLHDAFSDVARQEEGSIFAPKFDRNGLLTAVVTDANTNEVLMVAYMNAQAVKLTLETGIAHYWSRSRSKLWKKGETSGNLQKVIEIKTDCDQDSLWLKVQVAGHGATCHTGQNSCFYRTIKTTDNGVELVKINNERLFNPSDVYK